MARAPCTTPLGPASDAHPSFLTCGRSLTLERRDIKPENIFINLDGELQVGDFGLAADKHVDQLIERVGTLDYMAPEVSSSIHVPAAAYLQLCVRARAPHWGAVHRGGAFVAWWS